MTAARVVGFGWMLIVLLTISRLPDNLIPSRSANGPSGSVESSNGAAIDKTSVPEPWLQDMAKSYAGRYLPLKDPDSAIYTNTTYRTRHGEPFICGFVNAKNSFGAYPGPEAFVIGGGSTTMEGSASRAKFQRLWQSKCIDTDASDSLKAPEHPRPTSVSDDKAATQVRPLLNLADSDTASFSRTTYRTRYGLPITCGFVSVNHRAPVAYVLADGAVSRADIEPPESFKFTWSGLCAATDASQDADERSWDKHHAKKRSLEASAGPR
jgi:hypothetical protein